MVVYPFYNGIVCGYCEIGVRTGQQVGAGTLTGILLTYIISKRGVLHLAFGVFSNRVLYM